MRSSGDIMYVELHAHSNFSLLDGASFPEKLVEAATHKGMTALALTDHDGLYAAPRFCRAAKDAGIKPIVGAEVTLEGGNHLTLLVRDATGYANLSALITKAQLSGVKGSPRLDAALLARHHEGLICLSGCARGAIPSLVLAGRYDEAAAAVRRCLSVFGQDNFFIEVQHHLDPGGARLCRKLCDLARALGVPAVATNNVHYAARDGHRIADVLACIKNRVCLDDSAPFRRPNSEYYLKACDEMGQLPGLPIDAIRRTFEVADACVFDLDFSSYSLPAFDLPPGETAPAFLRRLCIKGMTQKYGEVPAEAAPRLAQELDLIERKGMCGYFLIVWDIMEFARKSAILAQGRGSAASSLVAYLLGITPVDPIRHDLFVGRFLNESSAVPDIDIDIDTRRREEVIQYVYRKYGEEHAAMVCTYVTFRARNAIREVGKAFGVPPHVLDRMAKSVSAYSSASAIEDLKNIPEFTRYLGSAAWGRFCAIAAGIADFPRHLSIHVGGMVVSSKPISRMVPLERARAEGRVVCQWDKDGVDDAGLIKVDLLGLRMLSLIDEALCLIKAGGGQQGATPDFDRTAEDDPHVYDMIGRADTVGVFQVESRAQMQSLPRVRPRSLEDLGVEVAIIRPGPLQGHMVHPYMRRRNGREAPAYLHPLLEPVLRETLGVILFQEQILQVAMAVAGFSAAEANGLRKAMGRKYARAEFARWHERFIGGAKEKEIDESCAQRIFDLIGGFAEFGFCKSHAMSFALLCYRSAYLKLYYPTEFYCALLNNQPMGFYLPEVVVGDAKRHGIAMLPVDVNVSGRLCAVEGGEVRLGFRYVKDLGEDASDAIAAARAKGGLFRSFKDFAARTRLDKAALRSLIIVGAFDGLERSRRQLLWALGAMGAGSARQDAMDLDTAGRAPLDEMSGAEELLAVYGVQGFSATGHLLDIYREDLARLEVASSTDLPHRRSGAAVRVSGYNVCLQMPPTAKGFAFVTLEDRDGLINVVIRPDVYGKYRQVVRLEPLLVVDGTLERKDGVINVMAEKIAAMDPVDGGGEVAMRGRHIDL
jgi:error-prone DNA polymerase